MGWGDWVRTIEIEPSLYAADFAHLGEQVDHLLNAGARVFHFDIGDGHFVEPITIGPVVLRSIASLVHARDGVLDCHLMVTDPAHHIPQVAAAGGDSVTVHVEVVDDPTRIARLAREHGLEVGLALNPETAVDAVVDAAGDFGLVNCMSVHPGYSGQEFIPESLDRVRELRERLPEDVIVQVDGGINEETIRPAYDAGAQLFVAASAIFGREDLPRAYRRLLHELA